MGYRLAAAIITFATTMRPWKIKQLRDWFFGEYTVRVFLSRMISFVSEDELSNFIRRMMHMDII